MGFAARPKPREGWTSKSCGSQRNPRALLAGFTTYFGCSHVYDFVITKYFGCIILLYFGNTNYILDFSTYDMYRNRTFLYMTDSFITGNIGDTNKV